MHTVMCCARGRIHCLPAQNVKIRKRGEGICVFQTRTAECICNLPLTWQGKQIALFTLFGGENSSERTAA